MLIDKPMCSFTQCRKNQDHNCFASYGQREGCEFRVNDVALDIACKAISVISPKPPDVIRVEFEQAVVKQFKG